MMRIWTFLILVAGMLGTLSAADTLDSARNVIRSRDYPSAILILDGFLKNEPTNAEAVYLKAYVLEKQNKVEDALSHYAEAKGLAERARPANATLAKKCEQATARLDRAREVILAAADSLERKAASFKSRDPFAYERLMKVVWHIRESENSNKRPIDRNAEATIRRRYMGFFLALSDRNLDKALNYVDPEVRQQASDGVVKGVLGVMAGAIKMAKLTPKSVDFESVTLGMTRDDAKVIPTFKINGNKDTQKPIYWVKRNGIWYWGDEKKLKTFK